MRDLQEVLGNAREKNIESQSLQKIQSELDEIITIKLLWENLPSRCVASYVKEGQLILEDKNEFKVSLTIRNEKSGIYLWTIFDVQLFDSSKYIQSM